LTDGNMVVVSPRDDNKIADGLFDNIFDNKIPAICLVSDGNHWVVCHKLIYTRNDDRHIALNGVFILDPSPDSPPEVYVPIDEFLSKLLTPNVFGTNWRGKRVFLSGSKSKVGPRSTRIKSISRSQSVLLVTQKPAMGGGAEGGMPNLEVVRANLGRVGITEVKRPLGGGSEPLLIIDLSDNSFFYILLFDAQQDTIFKSLIYAAVGSDSRVLEVTADNRAFFASDTLVLEAISSQIGKDNHYEIDKQLYWKRNSLLRNRFILARRATKDGNDIWVLPNVNIVTSPDAGRRGGA